MAGYRPLKLINTVQHYAWGTRDASAFIPKLLDEQPEPGKPYAELWMGTHPNAPSIVETRQGIYALDAWIAQDPTGILGAKTAVRFNNRLPFLFKILSAGEALSIQAHPDKKQAERLHQTDPEHYPDDNHKPEIAIAIDDLQALVGFRPVDELKQCLTRYPELAEFIEMEIINPFLAEKDETAAFEQMKSIYMTMMQKSQSESKRMEECLRRLTARLQEQKAASPEEKLFLSLRAKYGCDVGLFNLFILNYMTLQAGQAVYLPAGIPHAYLKGNIVECMANSDNVVRAGLTPKFKDVETLTEILRFNTQPLPVISPPSQSGIFRYQTPAPEFLVNRINLTDGQTLAHRLEESLAIGILFDGRLTISTGHPAESRSFEKGQAFVLPAALREVLLRAQGHTILFLAQVPSSN